MAFAFDPEMTNQALSKVGSSYQVDAPQPAVAQAAQPAAEPAAGDMQSGVKPEAKPAATEGEGWGDKTAGAVNSAGEATDNSGLKKLGGLVGTVMSFYTGNYAGGAKGLNEMRKS